MLRHRVAGAGLAAALFLLAGCDVDIPEARFACVAQAQCPLGWHCRADRLCHRTPDGDLDGGPDGGRDGGDGSIPGDGGDACVSAAEVCNGRDDDCDGDVDEDFDLSSDRQNCGACGQVCNAMGGEPACTDGRCAVTCTEGLGDCDADPTTCETDLTTASHCGSCGTSCPSERPVCTPSGTGYTCESGCGTGQTLCGTSCVDTSSSVLHCGACDDACPPGSNATSTCSGGVCGLVCSSGFDDCDGDPSTGCETSLRTLSSCGSCGTACGRTNATATCSTGSCRIASCSSGWGNCDGADANGCETRLNTLSSCGGCGTSCSRANATATCSTGSCRIASCNSGWESCDGMDANGCEVNVNTSFSNCGACGTSCSTSNATSCSGGVCRCGTIPSCSGTGICCGTSCVTPPQSCL